MKLPESWIETTLADIAVDLQPGFAQKPGEEDDGSIPQMRTHNVSPEGKITLDGIKFVTPSEHELEKYSLKKGDILFNNTNSEEWVGKTAVFDQEGSYVFSNHMTRIRANTDIVDPYFLSAYLHLLWSVGFSKNRAKRWVNQASVDGKALGIFQIPLPTMIEQKRIVDVLHQAKTINDNRKRASTLTSQIAREQFFSMFGHPAENPHGFDIERFSKLGLIERGVSKHRPRDADHLLGGPYPFIQTGDVTNAGDWITEYKSTYSEAGLAQSRLWPKGTLCITIAANIARASILDFDGCFPDSVVGFTPHEGIYTEYILYCIRFYQEYFEARAPKSAQMNINLEILKRLRIPKPPTHLQQKFSELVQSVRNIEDRINHQLSKQTVLNSALKFSAYSGELTEDWRIKNEKEIEKAVKSRNATLAATKGRQFRSAVKIVTETKSEISVEEKKTRRARNALLKELSNLQRSVRNALQNWKGVLIPDDTAVLDQFCNQLSNENEGNIQDRALRTLDQLAALGLIAKVSLPNEQGRYLTCFRMLREGEARRTSDIQAVNATIKRRKDRKATG